MAVRIVEVITRSEQGITRPFLCRGDDGLQYFVKGNGAGRKALISEWIAGNLGKRLGLPIPNFQQVVVPRDIVQYSARSDIRELGAGFCFGSQVIENTDELAFLFIEQIDPELRAKVLLFDWWICNSDRTLTADGGNPNLLWVHRENKLYVIDQNAAFEEEDLDSLWERHIFRESRNQWDLDFEVQMTPLMERALNDLQEWWKAMPEDWLEIESGVSLKTVERLLSRFEQKRDIFWRRK